MYKSKFFFALCTVLAMSAPLLAVDGVTLIDQATVTAGGGFPYQIAQPGSYRLSGNLVPPGTGAINITAADVTLDLNGFSISCTTCSGVPGIKSTGVRTVILNGNVAGFNGTAGVGTPYGIFLLTSSDFRGDHGARIDQVNADDNCIGIFASSGVSLSVTNSSASWNTSTGISAGPSGSLTVANSRISNNGLNGILMGNGVITGNALVGNGIGAAGLRGAIGVAGNTSAATVTNNVIGTNGVFGIFAAGATSPLVGFGSNTFFNNGADVGAVSTFYSMKNNVCSGGGC
jgi:hypothetical protein